MAWSVGSMFSGIGGLDLGLERAGMTVAWQAEVEPYCARVLTKHWPQVPNLGDVTAIDWSTVEPVDLVCGGYPCQPFSLAGARRGSGDARHLWPYMRDALGVLRPRLALLENVPGHLSLGFDRVLGDLAELGYDTEWDCIPAAAVGAPHLRYRVFIVAHARGAELREQPVAERRRSSTTEPGDDGAPRTLADPERAERWPQPEGWDEPDRNDPGREEASGRARTDGEARRSGPMADADGRRLEECTQRNGGSRRDERVPLGDDADRLRDDVADADADAERWRRRSRAFGPRRRTESADSRVGDTDRSPEDSLAAARRSWGPASESGWWAVEPYVGRVAHGVPARVDRLRGLGNAVVPQVAQWIGERIMSTHPISGDSGP